MSKSVLFRRAQVSDASSIARIHTASWRHAYQGQVPSAYLDGLSVEKRTEFWSALLKDSPSGFFTFVVQDVRDEVLGFVRGANATDDKGQSGGELTALYLEPGRTGQGLGTQLFQIAMEQFVRDGHTRMHLWVLSGNPATHFYEKRGGRSGATKDRDFGGQLCPLTSFHWDDLEGTLKNIYPHYRHPCIKHYTEMEELKPGHYPGSSEPLCTGAPLGRFFDLARLGIHHETLAPGTRTSWPHAESTEDELIYVLEGHPHAWIDGFQYPLQPGDVVGFKAGSGIAHTFLNNSNNPVRILVIGDRTRTDNRVYYPKNPLRNQEIGSLLWQDAPVRRLGPHDGMARIETDPSLRSG